MIMPINTNITNSNMNLSEFLKQHAFKDGDSEKTNSRIPSIKNNIYGGTYCIPDNEYNAFLDIYYRDVVINNKLEFITEKQREQDGPIAIDIDLKYAYDVTEKQYTNAHIADLIDVYLEQFKNMYQFDKSVKIPIYIFEKLSVNRLQDKQVTKDGIHIIIGLQADRTVQIMLRQKVIEEIQNVWDGLPIINDWEDIFDAGISKGCVNWQLYGSRKPEHEPYKLTQIYNVSYDENDGELMKVKMNIKDFDMKLDFKKLSVRYTEHQSLFFKGDFADEYDKLSTNKATLAKKTSIMSLSNSTNTYCIVRNIDEMRNMYNSFIDNIPHDDKYELRDTSSYAMILPESFYGVGSFTRWIRVGMALRNISDSLLIVWIAMSAKSEAFKFDTIEEDIYKRWAGFTVGNQHGLTKRSIMYWAKEYNPTEYKLVYEDSVDFYLSRTIESITVENINSKNPGQVTGCGDWDIAEVLYHLHKDEYICSSIKHNNWYKYHNHRWTPHEDANDLRTSISTKLRNLYSAKACVLATIAGSITDTTDTKIIHLRLKAQKILDICVRLGKTNEKQNIIKEARSMYYDCNRNFLEKLDTNPYLICFNNGVIDFKETDKSRLFRKGYPEDELSMCTHINYIILNDSHKPIINEINEFMSQLFPDKEICDYMWEHLASTLIGVVREESFNMYIGKGRNGKSKLIDLMKFVLGDYLSSVPLELVTGKRPKLGGCTPEIQSLKGVRFAIMNEPSKGERINDGAMKMLTGGDVIEGRGLYQEKATKFKPQFKLAVCSNQFMEVKTQDDGTWRRIRVVEYKSKFTENPVDNDPEYPYQFLVDDNIYVKFERWKEVFASMLVDITFINKGSVHVPDCVLSASKSYRESQDYIAEFIKDKIIVDPKGKIKKTELNSDFSLWYMSTYGRGGPPPKDVHAYMDKAYGKSKIINTWTGIKLRYDRDEQENMDDDIDDIEFNDL